MHQQTAQSAAAVLIGNELLSGKIREANLFELAQLLRALGIRLRRATCIADHEEEIAAEVRAASERYDVVFTSGGVGPTHDDVTISAVARAFGVTVTTDPVMEQLLKEAYGARCTPSHLRMALVPEGAALATTPEIRWPTVVMKNVWVLPGVPEIFRMKLDVVRAWLSGPGTITSRAVFTQIEEADLKEWLDRVVAVHPSVEVGSYPKWFDETYKTKVTFDGANASEVERAVAEFLALLPEGEPQRTE